ncbi:uncharacterized protein CMC5_020490 [Chondromyces crocatus]|uniref:DUF2786 domain-containing protein n=1 Tax=Chondromyces crocatus TaxID=52 RepID=A0A0K1EAJ5_CHOCO|nr:uncharacterized protein CMC5_020490 [Chondromyces crocatus]
MRELLETYHALNYSHFRRKLQPAVIALSDTAGRLGRWVADARLIEIGRRLVLEQPWGVVVEVLKHEMAHQYVYEVLKVTHETAHGPRFREVCETLGIDAVAAGMPTAVSTPEENRVLERISRLMALAESANVHEAEAAMAAAQRLMLKYNLDLAQTRAVRRYGFRHVGKPTGRVTESERIVGGILVKHFFVEAIWTPMYLPLEGKRGSVLEICGTTANLEMAAYVHAFLHHTAEQLWLAHKRANGIQANRDRRTFTAGVMLGFLEKLNAERKREIEKGLVWVQDADLSDYYRARYPRVHHVRHSGNQRTEAHAHGRAAGRQIELRRPLEGEGRRGSMLLPPKRG